VAAGFQDVAFELEPIAAAFDYERRLDREAVVLVVDVGGGTSDFTVVRLGPKRMAKADRTADILATTGVHIGGTDFDRKLNLSQVMPLLGLGHTGPQGRPVPSPVFMELATWHLINFQYTPRVLAQVQGLRVNYSDTRLHDRLVAVLKLRLGHRLASEVEQAKILCSQTGGQARIDLDEVERGLRSDARCAGHGRGARRVARPGGRLRARVRGQGLPGARRLDAIYLTGGSSALQTLQDRCAPASRAWPLVEGDLFGGVAAGLAYAAQRR
jgi:hypothetical chaperone protein